MRFWPKSIRWQMLAGVLLLEALSLVIFVGFLTWRESDEVRERARQRLAHQANSVALQIKEAYEQNQPGMAQLSVRMMGEAPSVSLAKFTDAAGNVLLASAGQAQAAALTPIERQQLPLLAGGSGRVFDLGKNRWEGARPVYFGGTLRGIAWVETDRAWDQEELETLRLSTGLFGLGAMAISGLLAFLMARSITRPLAVLHAGTNALMNDAENRAYFPLPVTGHSEFSDLIETFNRMVASIGEQRSGLNDTLSMLDSMLANAPIGLAFFDRQRRFVRVNQVFADMTGTSLSGHLGRTLPELLPAPMAQELEDAVARVLASETPVRNAEMSGQSGPLQRPWAWLVSAYPVRTVQGHVRWAGVIALDTTDRRRNEEALRRTEKLAAAGRLAASIAHEINNPLEAITNLLFLLRNYCNLENPALNYVEMAEHEARRIAEIAQQTLRFYRQSTLPARANLAELLDSVLALYQVRLHNLGIEVARDYDPEMDLYCFAGEVRQVIANLVGNALDATARGGRLIVRARPSRNWKQGDQVGVRFTIADTGSGFGPEVRQHIFEAFFTTKDATGTGLGLWVSHEIVLKHQGMVHVRSRASGNGKPSGTVFQVFFPDNQALQSTAQQTVTAEA